MQFSVYSVIAGDASIDIEFSSGSGLPSEITPYGLSDHTSLFRVQLPEQPQTIAWTPLRADCRLSPQCSPVRGATRYLSVVAPPSAPPPPPPRAPTLPTMTGGDAKHYISQELTNRFGNVFRHRRRYAVSCSRDSRTQFRCRTSWYQGPYYYSGIVVVFYGIQNQTVYWFWRLGINRVSSSCNSAWPRRHCSTRIHR